VRDIDRRPLKAIETAHTLQRHMSTANASPASASRIQEQRLVAITQTLRATGAITVGGNPDPLRRVAHDGTA
jgi:hypothetical protein